MQAIQIKQQELHDIDEQASALHDWEQRYQQIEPGRFRGKVTEVRLRGGVLLRETSNCGLQESLVPPDGNLVFALPLSLSPGSLLMGQAMHRDAALVLRGRAQYDLVTSGEMDLIGLSVHQTVLDALLTPEEKDTAQQAQSARLIRLESHRATLLRRLLLLAIDDAVRLTDNCATHDHQAALLTTTLIQTVQILSQGLADAEPAKQASSTLPRTAERRRQIVHAAVRTMREHAAEDLTIQQICATVGVSRRTLQYCFEEFLHTSPLHYFRTLRLNEARRALKRQRTATVTEIAGDWGFSSPSYFTTHYKQLFGELPSRTRGG